MAGSRKRPGKYPEWLFDPSRAFPDRRACKWLCSGCGAPYWFLQPEGRHGGPQRRSLTTPYYSAVMTGPCYRSHEYGVKCVTPKGTRVLIHEGSPNPEQPDQPDLENIKHIIATRAGRRRVRTKDNRDQKGGRQ